MQTCWPPKGGGEWRTCVLYPEPSSDLSAKLCRGRHTLTRSSERPSWSPERAVSVRRDPFPPNLHNMPRSPRTSSLPLAPLCPAARVELEGAGFRGTGRTLRCLSCSHSTEGQGLLTSAGSNISKCRKSWLKPDTTTRRCSSVPGNGLGLGIPRSGPRSMGDTTAFPTLTPHSLPRAAPSQLLTTRVKAGDTAEGRGSISGLVWDP